MEWPVKWIFGIKCKMIFELNCLEQNGEAWNGMGSNKMKC